MNLEEAGSNLKAEVTMVVEVRQAGGLVRLVVATSGGQGTPLMELFASHPSLHRIDCSQSENGTGGNSTERISGLD